MQHDLDLSLYHWKKDRMGVTAIGTWIRLEGTFRPCMVLIRAGSEKEDGTVPCVITVDRAYLWEPETAGDFSRTIALAVTYCEALRLSLDKTTVVRLMDFINDYLSDLLSIPPFPVSQIEAPVVAEIVLTDTNGRTIEREMKDV